MALILLCFLQIFVLAQAFVTIDLQQCMSQARVWNRAPRSLTSNRLGKNHDPSSAEQDDFPLLLLPFPVDEALSIGQTRSIVLKEGRFLDLVQDVVEDHASMLGMALMGDDALLDTIVICKIEGLQVDAGFRGRVTVQATLKAMGRGSLVEILQFQPTMKALCATARDTLDGEVEEEISLLHEEIERNIGELGLLTKYERFLKHIIDEELATASDAIAWAVLSTIPDGALVAEALTSSSPIKRLGLAAKVLRKELARSSLIDFNSKYE